MTHRNARTLAPKLVAPLAAAAALIAGAPAHAEFYGIMNGRTAAAPEWNYAVEAAIQLDDDFRYLGVRGNYALSDVITAFANISQADVDDSALDGVDIGGGVFYRLPDQQILPSFEIAFKPSLSYSSLSGAGGRDADFFKLAAEVLLSGPEPIQGTSLEWYANAGLAIEYVDDVDNDSDTDLEPIIGGGVVLPAGPGQLYAGVDYIDNIQFGAGFRYGF